MTINIADNSPRITYTVAQGVTQTSFVVPFEFFDDEDLNVYVDGVLKTLNTHYTTTGGDGSTGSITMSVTGGTGGSSVVITRSITLERVTDFPVSGAFNIVALNTELDRFVAIAADLEDKASRALQLTDYDISTSLTLPDLNSRKGRTLAFNSSTGAAEAGPLISDVNSVADASADIALLADIQDGTIATDAITDLAAIKTDVTSVAGIASSVTALNAISSEIAAVGAISSDVTTVAGISANVTTVAGISANVTTVAGSSASIGTVATNIADVSAVATNLSDVQSFANTYRIASSDPATSLDVGDLVFNTTDSKMKVYNGSAWQDVAPVAVSLTVSQISDLTATATELNRNDITTLGTSEASKVVTADANGDIILTGELKATSYNEAYSAVTSTTNATTVDCEAGNAFSHTLTENTTFTFSNPPASGTAYSFSLEIIQDASASGYTVTWPTSVDWPSATAPTLTATASAVDVFVFYTRDGGTIWQGFIAGQAQG